MLILKMTHFDTAQTGKIKKCRIDFQHFTNKIVQNIQILIPKQGGIYC